MKLRKLVALAAVSPQDQLELELAADAMLAYGEATGRQTPGMDGPVARATIARQLARGHVTTVTDNPGANDPIVFAREHAV